MKYVEWFEQWLNSLASAESSRAASWNSDLANYSRHRNTFSQNEVAIELYHALHQSDLSLKELSLHIEQIGNLLYQVDTRQLATQPLSRRKEMLAAFFDCPDLSQALPACHRQDSFAYVYLLVRLLYEVLLYTKSSAVRTFCYYQIMRNAHVVRVLFGLISREVSLKGTEGYVEGETQGSVDCMSTVGQLPRQFSSNAIDDILLKVLTSKDINLRSCGLELVRLSPRIVACNPKLLSQLKDTLIGPMDECAYKAAISLVTILECVTEDVAQVFLQSSHDHTLQVPFSHQRVQSFCCIALGSRKQPLYALAYRMCWNIWIHLDSLRGTTQQLETLIVREAQFYLLLTSTLLCNGHEELCVHQRKRLEALIYEQQAPDASTEVAFCMNVLYHRHGDIREVSRLIKHEVRNAGIVQEVHTTLFRLQLKQFKQSRHPTPFLAAIGTFERLLTTDVVNFKLLGDLKDAFKFLRSNYMEYLVRILKITMASYENFPYELDYLRTVIFRNLSTVVKICYICEHQKFTHLLPEIKDIVKGCELIFLFKPLVTSADFQNIDDRFNITLVNMWVKNMYDLCHIKPPAIHNYIVTPIRIDLISGGLKLGSKSWKAAVLTKKDIERTDSIREHIRCLINANYKEISSGYAMLQVINLSLRLGFYEEAYICLKQLELWTHHTHLWFNGLYYYACGECQTHLDKALEYRVQGLDSLDSYHHQCTLWALQKVANDVMAPKMNYTMPPLVLYTWCTLKFLFQVAVGHLCKAVQTSTTDGMCLKLIFVALFGHFKVLRWCFKGVCNETSDVLQIYEGLCLFLYLLCEKEQTQASQPIQNEEGLKIDPNDALKTYITGIFESNDVHIPQTCALLDLLTPAVKARLYSVPTLLSVRAPIMGKVNKVESDPGSRSQMEGVAQMLPTGTGDLSPENMFKEFVLYSGVRSEKDKPAVTKTPTPSEKSEASLGQTETFFSYLSRDIDELNALLPLVKACETSKKASACKVELLESICSLKLPTPVGVLKHFPLPFPALTAILEYEKRSNTGPVAIHLQGSIRNSARQIPWVKVKLETDDAGNNISVIFNRRLKLRQNVLDEHVHVHLSMSQIEHCRFSCVAVDNEGCPRGIATHFVPATREFNA